ncbi:sulfatase family protein [Lacipirellula sp.]|uniref:sulfatase family protein n=1 Tax=Lacipirellula sp. TaxID=2691419 RepID=UPI003D13AA5D
MKHSMLFRIFAAWCVAILAPEFGQAADAPAKKSPPNIVMILSDDQGYRDYGFMGHHRIETPRLDELASQSLTFTHGYVPSSVCRPSLVSIVTGLYPHQHRITSNDPPPNPDEAKRLQMRNEQIAYIDKSPTLPRLLAPLGYTSFQAGKWWEGHYNRGGFTEGMTHGDASRKGRHGDEGLQIGRDGITPVREFLDRTEGKPFLLWYAPMMPHLPHNAPERLVAKYREKASSKFVARYFATVEWFDETCGEVLDELDKRGLADNTIVVYVTDNGWIQDPKSYQAGGRSKLSPYDGGLRTPIMVRWPGKVAPKMVPTPVSSIDIAPTILDAVGLKPTADMEGVNLLDSQAVADRKAIFGETFTHEAVDLHRPSTSLEHRWCVSMPWKLIIPNAANEPDGQVELFNIKQDPKEEVNLAAENPEVVAKLTKEIDDWWAAKD